MTQPEHAVHDQAVEDLLAKPAEQHLVAAAQIWVRAGSHPDPTQALLRALLHAQFAAVKTAITYGEEPAR